MRKTTPGVDRIMMTYLRAQVADGKRDAARHMQHCSQCTLAQADTFVHCREWWRIKMKLYQDQLKLAALELPENPQQEELFSDRDR